LRCYSLQDLRLGRTPRKPYLRWVKPCCTK
jgi:hypothetical protein